MAISFVSGRDGKPAYVSRRKFGRSISNIDKYALAVGDVTIAWNWLHFEYQTLLGGFLVGYGKIQLGFDIWLALRSDDLGRSVLREFVRIGATDKRASEALLWSLGRADKLAQYRNLACHTPIAMVTSKGHQKWEAVGSIVTSYPQKRARVSLLDAPQLEVLAADLRQLAGYVGHVAKGLDHDGKRQPLPRRPHLRFLRLVEKLPSPQPPANRPKRLLRRFASPAL